MSATQQPTWKLIVNLGDVNPIDYGGFFVYVDETGEYEPEAELLEVPPDNEAEYNRIPGRPMPAPTPYRVYRFRLDRCTFINGVLSDNRFHTDLPAWFAKPEEKRADRPQDTTYLSNVADCMGADLDELRAMFCSDDPIERAQAWRMVGEYHGFENLDSYPLELTRAEAVARYEVKK